MASYHSQRFRRSRQNSDQICFTAAKAPNGPMNYDYARGSLALTSPRLARTQHGMCGEEIEHPSARIGCGLGIVSQLHAKARASRQLHVEGMRGAGVNDEVEGGSL